MQHSYNFVWKVLYLQKWTAKKMMKLSYDTYIGTHYINPSTLVLTCTDVFNKQIPCIHRVIYNIIDWNGTR